jgi:ATP-binding cassette subfamily C (CFTR/MRP) protein 1
MASFDIVVAGMNTPWALATIPIILIAMFILLKFYINTFREVSRLGSVTKSPLMNHLGETINGATTIRSFNKERSFIRTNYDLLNTNTNVSFWREGLRSWFAIRIEFVSLFLLAFTTGFLVRLTCLMIIAV